MRQQNADLRQALKDQAAASRAENDDLRHRIGSLKEKVTAAGSSSISSNAPYSR
jgi:hypothetical protein